jgi:signal recognition particle receptor subunit beta
MASINYAAREISVKVVYYGPGLSGKTTNLQVIHKKTPQEHRSDMVSLATETDRTLFFDFLPLDLGKIKGFSTKFQLYTVPGQVYYNATRKLVLRGVDGVVFVADSGADKIQENLESFQNLEDNLAEYGYQRESIPIILQYNKRDLPNALTIEELQKHINKYNLPYGEGIAYKGVGVFDTLKQIGKIVIDHLNKKYSKPSRGGDAPAAAAPAPAQATVQQPQAAPQYVPPAAPQYQPPQQNFAPPPPVQPQAFQQQPQAAPQYVQPAAPQQQYAAPPPAAPAPAAADDPFFVTPSQQFQQQYAAPPVQPAAPVQNYDDVFTIEPTAPPQQQAFTNAPPMSQQQFQAPPQSAQQPVQNYNNAFILEPAGPAAQTPAANIPPPAANTSFDPFEFGAQPAAPLNNGSTVSPFGQMPPQGAPGPQVDFQPFNPPAQAAQGGSRSELDMEIEKYQREIEEKQKKMRASGSPGQAPQTWPESTEMQSYPGPSEQNFHQSPQNRTEEAGTDSGMYNMNVDGVGNDEVFFTSVDMNKQKKPIKRPVNPAIMKEQQKGFIKKLFNKDNTQ